MNLLITGAWRDADRHITTLKEHGHQIVFMQHETDELPCDPGRVEGIVCNGLFLSHDIRLFTSLKYLQLTSAGYDRVPTDVLDGSGIILRNARGVYSIPMAEHAVASALYFFRNLGFFTENQKCHLWQKDRSLRELSGRTVCIIGCGSVGVECAKRFKAFDCKIIGLDIDSIEKECFDRIEDIANIHEIISAADIVILTLPLTEKTEGMADESFFASLKEGCVLINIARGKLISADAMVKSLKERELYAALDVFEEEPLDENSPLWSMPNVLITPHNSFVSDRVSERLSQCILEGLIGGIGGDTLEDSGSISQE